MMLRLSIGALLAASAWAQQDPAVERPRLVVLCAVDQLASWVFEEGRPFFAADGGFQRLMKQGTEFGKCAYQHACTETGPGHATIGTGVPASVHGIVRNAWWSAQQGKPDGKLVYCVNEPMPALPDLPEGKDRGPGLLRAPTFASSLKKGVKGSKVASVSWKDRSAILMAGPDADAVVWIEATTGNLVTNTAWAKTTPAWVTRFNEERAIDGFFGSVWDRSGPEAAYAGLVDDRRYEVAHQNGTNQHTLPQPITGGKLEPAPAYYLQLFASPQGNTVVRLAAEAAVGGMELGADATTDLLCVSFSSTDVVGHVFGPDSVEARDALLKLDRELALFFGFLDGAVGAGRWALFLTADHGVGPTPEAAKAAGRDAGRGLLQTGARNAAEQELTKRFGKPPEGKHFFTHVGEFSFYFDQDVLAALRGERDAAAMLLEASHVAAEAAASARGISAAFATQDLLAPGKEHDALRASLVLALYPGRAGDVQLVVKPYWLDGASPASHGTPHAYDKEVVAFAIGPGVRAGARIGDAITPGFGAVWFAQMLGLPRAAAVVDTVPQSLLGGK